MKEIKVSGFRYSVYWILYLLPLVIPSLCFASNKRTELYLQVRRTLPAVVVNGATITHGQIEDKMNRLKRRDMVSSVKVVDDLTPAAIEVMATDLLIDEYVALQLAAKHNVQVGTEEVVQALEGLAGRAEGQKDFDEMLLKQGLLNQGLMSEGLKNLYIDRLRQQYAKTLPPPTEEELREFYETHKEVFQTTPERVLARQIFLVRPRGIKDLSEEDMKIRERADELIRRLKEGEDFAKLADRYTEDPDGIGSGGSMGWVVIGLGNELLEPYLFSMKPGEILDKPIRVVGGYSIPMVEVHEEPVYQPFEEARPRVIKGWQIEKFKEWIKEERKNATIDYYEDLPMRRVLEGKRPKKTDRLW